MNSENWYENEEAFFKNAFSASDKTITEWQKRGFSLGEATEWSTWGVTPAKASQYISDGMKVIPDVRFKYSEVGIRQAFEWESAGFDYDSAIEWLECGVKCETARVLRGKGVSVDDFSDYLLFDIPLNKAVKWLDAGFSGLTAIIWTDWKVSCERAIKYVEEGIHEPPDEQFREAGLSLAEALKWHKADIDFDTASDWIDWKVPASVAIDYVSKDIYPPEQVFRDEGISFEDSMGWLYSGIDLEPFEEYDHNLKPFWKNWHEAGFTPKTAKVFQAQLVEHVSSIIGDDVLARRRLPKFSIFNNEDREIQIKLLLNECVSSLSEIHKSGMKISLQNVIEWRGFTSEQIFACIDQGFNADTGFDLGNSLLSEDELEMHALLADTDFFSSPSSFSYCGLNSADLRKLIKLEVNLDLFVRLCMSHRLDGKELCKWAKEFKRLVTEVEIDEFGETKSLVSEWMKYEFAPKEAWGWYSENFTSTTAKAWLDSGVADPKIAKRRQEAGLEPK
jgi:hypothetical protein